MNTRLQYNIGRTSSLKFMQHLNFDEDARSIWWFTILPISNWNKQNSFGICEPHYTIVTWQSSFNNSFYGEIKPSNVPVAAAHSYTTTMQNLNRVILLIFFFLVWLTSTAVLFFRNLSIKAHDSPNKCKIGCSGLSRISLEDRRS